MFESQEVTTCRDEADGTMVYMIPGPAALEVQARATC